MFWMKKKALEKLIKEMETNKKYRILVKANLNYESALAILLAYVIIYVTIPLISIFQEDKFCL